jgi:hypothetical protein
MRPLGAVVANGHSYVQGWFESSTHPLKRFYGAM